MLNITIKFLLLLLIAITSSQTVFGQEKTNDFDKFETVAQKKIYHELIDELRCPKCQNQNLAGSDSAISYSLKKKTSDLVKQNKTKEEVVQYMIARYGDSITYKPPLKASTMILWLFPPVLLFFLIVSWVVWYNKKQAYAGFIKDTKENHISKDSQLSVKQQQTLDDILNK